MSLRLQVNLIITVLLGVMASLLVGLQIENTRRSVREEVLGANVVATQLLSRVEWIYDMGGARAMTDFLQRVGRLRANELELYDAQDQLIYRSPPTNYKAGREAPEWFARIVSPPIAPREIVVPSGRIVLRADPSRATLDGWDDLLPMLAMVLGGFLLVYVLVHTLIGRAMKPLQLVVQGLRRMEEGAWDTRLPELSGREGRLISQSFNRMAQSVQGSVEAQRQAREATLALAENRELTQLIQERIEQERGAIARELHDELSQQVTAIKSISLSIAHRSAGQDAQNEQSARLVAGCADEIYEGVHRLLARLRPLALDRFGLPDALADLLADWRVRCPGVTLELTQEGAFDTLDDAHATAIYRIAQEALSNALRHARAGRIEVTLRADPSGVSVEVSDDGAARQLPLHTQGHYGVVGMRERAQALGGSFSIEAIEPHGVRVRAQLPAAPRTENEAEQ